MSRAEDYLLRLLPEYLRTDDDGTLAAFIGAVSAVAFGPALRLADAADPDTSVTGTAEVVNPQAAVRPWLGWLGWLVGINLDGVPETDQRTAISESSSLQRRGSMRSIVRATQRTLTGSKSCRVYWNLSGSHPYLLTVVTLTSQTPDEPATLAAAWTEKPAGVDLDLQVVAGATYAELAAAFTDYDDLAGAFVDYDDLTTWLPPTP